MLHFAGILTVSVQSQAICKGKISHFPHCGVDKDTLHHAPVGIQLENYAFSILTWPDGLRAAIHGHFDALTRNQEGLVIKGLHQNGIEFNQKSKS